MFILLLRFSFRIYFHLVCVFVRLFGLSFFRFRIFPLRILEKGQQCSTSCINI